MDEAQFGLRQRPFRNTLDFEWYYPATGHEQALAQLVQSFVDGQGFRLLTGEAGTGKTLLCHRLLEKVGEETANAYLTNSHFCGRAGLLQAILHELQLPYEGRNEQELRLGLTQFLLESFAAGRRVLLLIDEAHHLTADLLEELRLLGNMESRNGHAMQVILVAQFGIEETVRLPVSTSFRQRLATRIRLEPFSLEESVDFLAHQIRTAGGRPEKVFSEEALDVLARACEGVPRLLNQAGQQALSVALVVGEKQVDAEIALEALAALGLQSQTQEEDGLPRGDAKEDQEPGQTPAMMFQDGDRAGQSEDSLSLERERRLGRLFATPRRPA